MGKFYFALISMGSKWGILAKRETILYPLYLLATLGLRSCEMCRLRWEDVDFETGKIKIRRNRLYIDKNIGCEVKDTKTDKSNRTLKMCDLLIAKLKDFKTLYDTLKRGGGQRV